MLMASEPKLKKVFYHGLMHAKEMLFLSKRLRHKKSNLRINSKTLEITRVIGILAKKKGYSGVGLYTKLPIGNKDVIRGIGLSEFDDEGRVIGLKFKSLVLFGCYFPNSQAEGKRLDFKLRFCDALLKKAMSYIESGCKVIISGDLNIAHKEIDLARPESNHTSPGFLPEERAWFTKALSHGFYDAFRLFNPEPNNYTWWSLRTRARERNIGWRIDTQLVSKNAKDFIVSSNIHNDVLGSDHCPISIEINH